MDADHRTVDEHIFKISILCERFKHLVPDAAFLPTGEPLINAVPFSKLLRQITPRRSASQNPQYRFKEQAVVRGSPTGISRFAR
jgi:hypothetical protein